MDKDLQDFENRQRLFISQRLEKHSKDISEYVDKKVDESEGRIISYVDNKVNESEGRIISYVDNKVNESEGKIISYVDQKSAEVLNASAEAHQEILARLARIESRLD